MLYAIAVMQGNLAMIERQEAMKRELGIEATTDEEFLEQLRERYPQE